MTFLRLTLFLALVSPAFADLGQSVVRVNTTVQNYSPSQPWEKTQPRNRRGLGAVLRDHTVLTTAKMAADAIYLEFQSADSSRNIPAKVIAIDYEANLALLGPAEDHGFLAQLKPTKLSAPLKEEDELEIVQLEEKGTTQTTSGTIRGLELLSTFVNGRYFLSYEVKTSIQTESNSYTLPAFNGETLAGIMTSYNSKEQRCDLISVDIIRSFLEDAKDGKYQGFPSLGIGYSSTEDPNFRAWLKLPEDRGGLYVSSIIPGGSADISGFKKDDVLLSIAGFDIDRKGYYQHPDYGTLFWTHLVRGAHQVGEKIPSIILRGGKELKLTLELKRSPGRLIPTHLHDQAPPYLIKGGMVFQELSLPYLQAFGKDWSSRAPLNLLDVYNSPEAHTKEGRRRVVVLTRVIPTDATIGYERIASQIVTAVNGQAVNGLPELAQALTQAPTSGLHVIDTDGSPYQVYLDEVLAERVDQEFKASGLPSLSRIYPID